MRTTDDFSVYISLFSLCIPSHFLSCTMIWKYCKTKVFDTQHMLNLRGMFVLCYLYYELSC